MRVPEVCLLRQSKEGARTRWFVGFGWESEERCEQKWWLNCEEASYSQTRATYTKKKQHEDRESQDHGSVVPQFMQEQQQSAQ